MTAAPYLSLGYLSAPALARQAAQWWDGVLGVAVFGASGTSPWPAGVPALRVGAPRLPRGEGIAEVWRAQGALREGCREGLRYRLNESMMFGCIELDETDAPSAGAGTRLQRLADAAYRRLFAVLDELGYPGLFRVWNYFPAINAESDGSERYWQFNAGRQDAFLGGGRSTEGNVPAACALGTRAGPFGMSFLALRETPRAIENPRQTSAYRYPVEYGPRSPTFARASLADGAAPVLFVSGTAAIVGHRSLHPGDAAAQTRETLDNVEAVLAEARRVSPRAAFRLSDLAYKVYVRHARDLEAVRAAFRARAGEAPVLFLEADICRADLLVEIEASGGHGLEMHP